MDINVGGLGTVSRGKNRKMYSIYLGTVSRGKNCKDPSAQSCALHIGTGPIYVIRRVRHTGTDMTHT